MVGKGALLIVFGFIMAFSMYQLKMSHNVLATSDNFVNNYMETLLHETALSAMNLAINKVWDQDVKNDTFMVRANHCSSRVEIRQPGSDTVRVKVKTWGRGYDMEEQLFVEKSDSITAYFASDIQLSKFFWFTENEGNVYWISGDTIWGPMHTNTVVKTWGSPVFYGKVTAKAGITPNPLSKKNEAEFNGGWEIGVENKIPQDMSKILIAAVAGNGGAAPNTKCIYDTPTSFEFLANGDVIRTVGANPPDTVSLATIAPTGAIYSTDEIRVKGTFNGDATIYSKTNIYIDDDLVYADNPMTNPNSDDLLGLVAQNDVLITDNVANNNDCNLQASIFAIDGNYGAENYASRPVSGVLRFAGSIAQKHRGPVGTFSYGTGLKSGFSKRYYYDLRL
ncbi:MAG: hypothetical protein P8048_04550, partial [Calditrichia bacterium]